MKLIRQSLAWGCVASLPLIALATFLEVVGTFSHDAMVKDDAYVYGDAIYLWLGFPLCRMFVAVAAPHGFRDIDNWWAVPLLDLLFVVQWAIYVYLIFLLTRAFRTLRTRLPTRKTV